MADPRVSRMAGGLVGSEILKIAAEIRAMMAGGERICNLTVGDFAPAEFPVPEKLVDGIVAALRAGETNYPPSDGIPALREQVAAFYARTLGLQYTTESVLVTSGSRPGLYAVYRAVVDPGDVVVYPVPSWNNNHYVHLAGARGVPVPCRAEDDFLPTRALLEEPLRGARLLALNSPLNPAGTAFTAGGGPGERPLYLLYDQVYWMLTFGATRHVDPVSLRPEMRDYTVFVDGISKAFAATGVRVGWTVGPADVTRRLAAILGHVGAWAPRAEQIATAALLADPEAVAAYHDTMCGEVEARLRALDEGLRALAVRGFPIETVRPMGAIYLSVRFPLHGAATPQGATLASNEEIREYLLRAAGVAVVPFQAFGLGEESGWFRCSVGAVSREEISAALERLGGALGALTGVGSRAVPA